MNEQNRKELFNIFRGILGRGFTQSEVNDIDAAIDGKQQGMKLSPEYREALKLHEAYKATTYPDPGTKAKPYTGGYGTTLDENGNPFPRAGITKDRAYWERLFERDVDKFSAGVSAIAGKVTQNQFDALVSLAYNIGISALKGSTLLRKHLAGDYKGAAAEFPRWNRSGGKVMAGLTTRRNKERKLYETP